MLEALSSFKMEEKLMCTKQGIAGIADLYRVTVAMHGDLGSMLTDHAPPGETLRKDFANFYFSFMGTKGCSPDTAATVIMLHASNTSQGFKLQVDQALQTGIGLTDDQIEEHTAVAAETGRLPDRRASDLQLKALSNGDWMGLFSLAVASM